MADPESVGHDWQLKDRHDGRVANWVCSKCNIIAVNWASKPGSGPFIHTFKSPLDGLTCEEAQIWRIQNQ